MPVITCKVTDEEKALIDRLAGTNRSDYMLRCLLAGPGGRMSGLSQVTEQINEVNRRLDILFDRYRCSGLKNQDTCIACFH